MARRRRKNSHAVRRSIYKHRRRAVRRAFLKRYRPSRKTRRAIQKSILRVLKRRSKYAAYFFRKHRRNPSYSTHVEFEMNRAQRMTAKDHKQRWVTMDGVIHKSPVPYRDSVSVRWLPIAKAVTLNYSHRRLAHSATGEWQ